MLVHFVATVTFLHFSLGYSEILSRVNFFVLTLDEGSPSPNLGVVKLWAKSDFRHSHFLYLHLMKDSHHIFHLQSKYSGTVTFLHLHLVKGPHHIYCMYHLWTHFSWANFMCSVNFLTITHRYHILYVYHFYSRYVSGVELCVHFVGTVTFLHLHVMKDPYHILCGHHIHNRILCTFCLCILCVQRSFSLLLMLHVRGSLSTHSM